MDMNMDGKTVIVAGLGVSGQSMMEVLGSRAGRVLGVDEKKPDADLHSFDQIDWDNTDMVMTSPVFNPRTPFILEAQKRNIPVMSEVELAWQLRVNSNTTGKPAQWIGITGTNGKTSTTEMTSEMLTACGLAAPAVGNIGKAVSHAAVDPANDVLCVELSSFQLHFTYSLELDCAAITNIADDHLDWHGGIENYAADKAKVFHNVKKALVYNADDERVTKLAFAAQTAPECRRIGFTLAEPKDGQIGVKDGWIVDMSGIAGGEAGKSFQVAKVTDFTHLTEPDGTVYPHLLADALTALALVLGLGADKDKALAALKQFTPGATASRPSPSPKRPTVAPSVSWMTPKPPTRMRPRRRLTASRTSPWCGSPADLPKEAVSNSSLPTRRTPSRRPSSSARTSSQCWTRSRQALPTFPCPSSIPRTTTPSWPAPSTLPAPTRNPAMWCSWLRPARPWTSSSRTPIAETSSRSRLSVG